MIFGDPRWLWGLLALPLLAALQWRAMVRAERELARLVGTRSDHVLLEQRRPGERRLSLGLRLAALAALLMGAADPQWGRELVRRGATGSDVVMVIDVSASMDARDVAPSRLEEARREALAVLARLEGSRVGVAVFAGDAVRLCPLTLDRDAVRLTLEGLSSNSVSEPGTDFGRALRFAARLMPAGRREEQAMVVWTDGEDLEHGASPAIDELSRTGIRVFAVGVGTAAGDVVPVLDDQGRAVDVKRDEGGGPVRSRLDETLLRGLAGRTHGGYFSANRPGGELPRLLAALSSLARSGRGQRLVERPVSRFPWLGVLAALLLAADRARPRRRVTREQEEAPAGRAAGARRSRGREAAAAAALLALLAFPTRAGAQSAWARGDRAFRAGRWAEAESLYARRVKSGHPRAAEVNLATARAELGKREIAERDLAALAAEDDPAGRAAGYNLGTILAQRRADEDALLELRRVLERDPGDRDARWNYEVVLHRKLQDQHPSENPPRREPSSGAPRPSGGGAGSGAPPPGAPSPNAPTPSNQGSPPPTSGAATSGTMGRTQADQILNALEEQARLQQGQHKVRVLREKHGRDW